MYKKIAKEYYCNSQLRRERPAGHGHLASPVSKGTSISRALFAGIEFRGLKHVCIYVQTRTNTQRYINR